MGSGTPWSRLCMYTDSTGLLCFIAFPDSDRAFPDFDIPLILFECQHSSAGAQSAVLLDLLGSPIVLQRNTTVHRILLILVGIRSKSRMSARVRKSITSIIQLKITTIRILLNHRIGRSRLRKQKGFCASEVMLLCI